MIALLVRFLPGGGGGAGDEEERRGERRRRVAGGDSIEVVRIIFEAFGAVDRVGKFSVAPSKLVVALENACRYWPRPGWRVGKVFPFDSLTTDKCNCATTILHESFNSWPTKRFKTAVAVPNSVSVSGAQ